MLTENEFGSFFVWSRSFVHTHDFTPVAKVSAWTTATCAHRLRAGAGRKPEQADENDEAMHDMHY